MKAIISVFGKDNVGILASVCAVCADKRINITDVSQTILGDMFAMIMQADISNASVPFTEFAEEIRVMGEKNNLVINAMHEDIFNSMHKV
ncbi:MAG: ACT domain-containing protein [Oscillospiraceae bacterium]|jgi:ACT domain-containing protein|nr:ACT domain-containing protein [Oscillospiraceae bacterium]